MRKIFTLFISLVLVLIVAAVAIPFLIPAETYKKEIISQVKQNTGRELVVEGAMKFSLFPTAGLHLEKVSFSNPEGYNKKHLFVADVVSLEVEALPLLQKQIIVKRLVLEKPVIDLEINKNGKPNWELSLPASKAAMVEPQGMLIAGAQAADGAPASMLSNLKLADVQIRKGMLSYSDRRSGVSEQVSDLDLTLSLADIASPLKAVALLTWKKELVRAEMLLTTPQKLLRGEEAATQLALKSGSVSVQFGGQAKLDGNLKGDLTLESPSLLQLSAWLASPMEWKGSTPLKFSTKGGLACNPAQCQLSNATIALDAIALNGDASVLFGGSVPTIKAKLVGDVLDINPYLPKTEARQSSLLVSDAWAAAGGWDDTPMNLKGLRGVNANVDLTLGGLLVQRLKLGKTLLNTSLKGGRLELDIPSTQLYGGSGVATVVLDASGGTAVLEKRVNLKGVQARPLLIDAMDFSRLSGTMEQTLSVRASGNSQRQMVGTLAGNGALKFTDGSISGINLAAMMRNVKGAFTGSGGAEEKTDFAELGGTFQIAQGIVSNKDLAMKAPLLRVRGEGAVDLPQRQVNYRVTPELVNSLEGQGGKDKSGLAIPVIVEGSLDNPSFRPDLASAAQDALKNPEKLKETIGGAKEQLKQLKNNGGKEQVDQIKGLIQGFGR